MGVYTVCVFFPCVPSGREVFFEIILIIIFSLVNGILFSGPFKNFYGKKAGNKSATASP